MISSGKPYPQYHEYNEAVTLTIFSAIDDVNFVKFIASEQARAVTDKMRAENVLKMEGKGRLSRYVKTDD